MTRNAKENGNRPGIRTRFVGGLAKSVFRHLPSETQYELGRMGLDSMGVPPSPVEKRNFFMPEITNLAQGESRVILRHIAKHYPDKFPKVLAVIPDGSGRFEEAHENLKEGEAYELAAQALYSGSEGLEEFGDLIETVMYWTWSDDNEKKRTKKQKQLTQGVIRTYLDIYAPSLNERNCKIIHIGDDDKFIDGLAETVEAAEKLTESNTGVKVVLAIDYGEGTIGANRVRRLRQPDEIIEDPETGFVEFKYRELSSQDLKQIEIDSMGMPYADITFRSAGEQRLSGLLPAVFGEIVVIEKTAAEITQDDFDKMLLEGICRRVTHGGVRPGSRYESGSKQRELFDGLELEVAFANILDQNKQEQGIDGFDVIPQ